MKALKQKLALYRTQYGLTIAVEILEGKTIEELDSILITDGDVRISKPIDVEFPPLNDGEILKSEITAIDNLIDNIKSKAMDKILPLQQKKQELLAITQQLE